MIVKTDGSFAALILAILKAVTVIHTARGRMATPAPASVAVEAGARGREAAAAPSHKLRAVTVSQVPRRSVPGASTTPVISVRFLNRTTLRFHNHGEGPY